MPKGYVIATEEVTDQARMEAFGQKAVHSLLQYGGTPLVVDDNAEVLEGTWHGTRTIVLEFESVEAAHLWYNSDEFQSVLGERQAWSDSNVVIASGVDMSG